MTATRSKREVAWRVFAREFNSSTVELPGDEQYAPTYLLSPLGALINRIYFTGVLTECENVGTDQEPLWRGRVSDPTDVFYISAGQFQPNAARVLGDLEVPALIGIVGKTRTYSPDESITYVSVRVELVRVITQELRDYWVFETCQSLNSRLGCMIEALRMDPPESQKLVSLGYSKNVSAGVINAISQYGPIEVQEYGELMLNTLKELALDTSADTTLLSTETKHVEGEVGINNVVTELSPGVNNAVKLVASKESKPTPGKDAEDTDEAQEKLIFEIINSLVAENPEGVIYEDVQAHAAEHGLERAEIEEYISALIDKGMIYEPSIGVFKAV